MTDSLQILLTSVFPCLSAISKSATQRWESPVYKVIAWYHPYTVMTNSNSVWTPNAMWCQTVTKHLNCYKTKVFSFSPKISLLHPKCKCEKYRFVPPSGN